MFLVKEDVVKQAPGLKRVSELLTDIKQHVDDILRADLREVAGDASFIVEVEYNIYILKMLFNLRTNTCSFVQYTRNAFSEEIIDKLLLVARKWDFELYSSFVDKKHIEEMNQVKSEKNISLELFKAYVDIEDSFRKWINPYLSVKFDKYYVRVGFNKDSFDILDLTISSFSYKVLYILSHTGLVEFTVNNLLVTNELLKYLDKNGVIFTTNTNQQIDDWFWETEELESD